MASNQIQEAQARETFLNDQAKGAAVHSFDPDATPKEKAAAAGKARDQLKDIRHKDLDPTKGSSRKYLALTRPHLLSLPTELAIDTGNSGVIPTITVHDVETHPEDVSTIVQPARTPGSFDAGPYVIPDWYKVGWRATSSLDSPQLQGEQKDARVLSAFLKEQYYGDWYHNAGLVFFVRTLLLFPYFFLTGSISFPDHICYPLYDHIPPWLGLVDHPVRSLCDILFHVYGPREEAGP